MFQLTRRSRPGALSHIFAKLGITTRAELAAQAAAHDPTAR